MKVALITLLLVILSGCGTVQKLICEDTSPPEKEVKLDPRMLEECRPLEYLPKEEVTFERVLVNVTDNAILYAECRAKQRDSVKLLKEFSNTK
jgi:hypothetical protein